MGTILGYMESDHKRCDALFAQLETSIDQKQWDQAMSDMRGFNRALERHLAMEEGVLFPAFEETTGSSAGPTSVMRNEHQYIREIVSRLTDAVEQRDADDFFGHADTLRIMMQQHNLKEESMLYVMADRILSGRQDEIIDAMAALEMINALGVNNLIE